MDDNLTFAQRLSHVEIITVFYFLQLLLYSISVLLGVFLIYLLKKIPVFHQNLRILLINWIISFLIIAISQFLSSIQILTLIFDSSQGLFQNLYYCQAVNAIFYFAGYMACLNLSLLVVERIVATVNVKTYEKSTSSTMGRNFVIFQWITCGAVVAIQTLLEVHHGYQGSYVKVFSCEPIFVWSALFLIPIIGVVVVDSSALIAFIILLVSNKRKYSVTFNSASCHSLSERYQISENIKVTRLLYPLVFSYASCSLLLCIDLFIVTLHMVKETATLTEIGELWIFTNIFYLILAVKANLLPLSILYGHPSFRTETKRRILCCWKNNNINPLFMYPKNVNGESLIISQESERSAHFSALDQAWN